jgi:hypothetical protein
VKRFRTSELARRALLLIFGILISASSAKAQSTLYAADGSGGNANCQLYTLDPSNGSVLQTIGPIGFPITGLAFDPTTEVLYGSVSNNSPAAGNLVTIDPATGTGTLVGSFGVSGTTGTQTMADLTFASDGTLYGWAEQSQKRLYTIDKTSGTATEVGPSGLTHTVGSGLAANSSNVLYFAGDNANGKLRIIDRTTGAPTDVVTMSGAPIPDGRIPAMAFSPTDTLYAGDLEGGGGGGVSHLITISTSTGVITDIGASVNGLDAIAFAPALQLNAAVSRKTHGTGTFDVNLPLTGEPGVECRTGGMGGDHTLVFTFSNNIVSGNASVTSGAGNVTGSSFAGKTMSVELTGVADAQQITVTLSGVTDAFSQVFPDTTVSMNVLLGDTTGNKAVNSSDIAQTKAQSGTAASEANFREDVTVNGEINSSDIALVKSRSGKGIQASSRKVGAARDR